MLSVPVAVTIIITRNHGLQKFYSEFFFYIVTYTFRSSRRSKSEFPTNLLHRHHILKMIPFCLKNLGWKWRSKHHFFHVNKQQLTNPSNFLSQPFIQWMFIRNENSSRRTNSSPPIKMTGGHNPFLMGPGPFSGTLTWNPPKWGFGRCGGPLKRFSGSRC